MRRTRRTTGAISLVLVVVMISVIFLGIAATSNFRRGVTRQLQTLLHNLEVVDIAEAALAEVAQHDRLVAYLNQPEALAEFRRAFTEGTYSGGVLQPAAAELAIPPTGIRARFAEDPRVRIGDVRLVPLAYRPHPERQTGLLRFVVGVTLADGSRTFARRVAADYEYSLFDGDEPGTIQVLLSGAPKAKVYP